MNEPYNCVYERIGSTSYLMCSSCGRVRETSVDASIVRDICKAKIRSADKSDTKPLTVSDLLSLAKLGTSKPPYDKITDFSGYSVGIRGAGALSGNVTIDADDSCGIGVVNDMNLSICYEPVRRMLWAILSAGSGESFKSIRWSKDSIGFGVVKEALMGGPPVIMFYDTSDGFEIDASGSMIVLPVK